MKKWMYIRMPKQGGKNQRGEYVKGGIHRVGVIAAMKKEEEPDKVYLSASLCSKKDNFNREVGKIKALGRLDADPYKKTSKVLVLSVENINHVNIFDLLYDLRMDGHIWDDLYIPGQSLVHACDKNTERLIHMLHSLLQPSDVSTEESELVETV